MAFRACVVSDSHLSSGERAPEAQHNWDAVVRYVEDTKPDVVIHVGDLCLDGNATGELEYARRQLDRLPVPWHAVPGNHDIGDNPRPDDSRDIWVDAARRERWLDTIGPDYWATTFDAWTVVAVNAQLFGSGLDAESEQWSWLTDTFVAERSAGSTALVTHKPLAGPADERASAPTHRYVPEPCRVQLSALAHGRPLDLVISGHVHQYRALDMDGTRHVWAPTTWAVLPDDKQPRVATKRCGVVTLELSTERTVEPTLVEPDGLLQLTLGQDLPNPYAH